MFGNIFFKLKMKKQNIFTGANQKIKFYLINFSIKKEINLIEKKQQTIIQCQIKIIYRIIKEQKLK